MTHGCGQVCRSGEVHTIKSFSVHMRRYSDTCSALVPVPRKQEEQDICRAWLLCVSTHLFDAGFMCYEFGELVSV